MRQISAATFTGLIKGITMLKEQVLKILEKEIIPVIKSGSMSARDRLWFRDESVIWMTKEEVSLTKLAADDILSVSSNTEAVSQDNLTQLAISVMSENPYINMLILNRSHYSKTVSTTGETVKPYVDDIAQIIGIDIRNYPAAERKKISRLFKSRSAVSIKDEGILCAGSSPDDAAAVAIIAEKAAIIHIQGSFFNKLTYIGKAESALMRFIYRRKYSKQAAINGRG